MVTGLAVLMAWGAASAAPPDARALLGRHFRGEPPAVAAPPSRPPDGGVPAPRGPFDDMHAPVAHMYITRQAYELYAARFAGSELSRYIGEFAVEPPASENLTTVAGAFDEDSRGRNPFNDTFPQLRHFWDCRAGLFRGLFGFDSNVDRAQKYATGGYGLDGKLDPEWGTGEARWGSAPGEGALALYAKGDKARAYWYLGHMAHLLEDLTVPAHALLYPHPFNGDDYEHFMGSRYRGWPARPADVETFETVPELYGRTCEITQRFDAGNSDRAGEDGTLDRGARRDGGFTEAELREEADVLMPLAERRVAALYRWFYRQVDHDGPRVALTVRRAGGELRLRALASDSQSGVDLRGFRFQALTPGGWTDVAQGGAEATVAAPPQARAFRVLARDGAGNESASEPAQLEDEVYSATEPRQNLSDAATAAAVSAKE